MKCQYQGCQVASEPQLCFKEHLFFFFFAKSFKCVTYFWPMTSDDTSSLVIIQHQNQLKIDDIPVNVEAPQSCREYAILLLV